MIVRVNELLRDRREGVIWSEGPSACQRRQHTFGDNTQYSPSLILLVVCNLTVTQPSPSRMLQISCQGVDHESLNRTEDTISTSAVRAWHKHISWTVLGVSLLADSRIFRRIRARARSRSDDSRSNVQLLDQATLPAVEVHLAADQNDRKNGGLRSVSWSQEVIVVRMNERRVVALWT